MGGEYATAGVAVERGAGAAQDFQAAGGAEVEVIELALAVGHGQWNAVEQDLEPAHPEGGAGAQPPQAEPVALREVVAIGDEEAGHRPQRFVEREAGPGAMEVGDDGGGQRQVEAGAPGAGGGDFGGGQLVVRGVRRGRIGQGRCGEQQE